MLPAGRFFRVLPAGQAALPHFTGRDPPSLSQVLLEVKGAKAGAPQLPSGPLGALLAPLAKLMTRAGTDPFYAVVAYRNFKPDFE